MYLRLIHATCAVSLLLALVSPAASAAHPYSYLIETTNEVLAIKRRSMHMSPEDARDIATRMCKTLQMLNQDPRFAADVDRLAKVSIHSSASNEQLADNLSIFATAFGPDEAKALRDAGVDEDATIQLLMAAGAMRASLRKPLDPEELHTNIRRLTGEVCKAATTATDTIDDQRASQKRWRRIRRWGIGIGGLSLIGIDATATTLSAGASTASFALGGALVGAAAGQ